LSISIQVSGFRQNERSPSTVNCVLIMGIEIMKYCNGNCICYYLIFFVVAQLCTFDFDHDFYLYFEFRCSALKMVLKLSCDKGAENGETEVSHGG
jgi:hypothetical protein